MKKGNEIAGLCFLFLCLLLLLWQTFSFESVDLGAGMSPAFWPRVIIGLCLLLIGIQIYLTLLQKRQIAVADKKSRESRSKIIIRLSILLGYLVSLPYLGFFWASPLFLFIAMSYLGKHGVAKTLLISLGTTAFLLVIYISLLYVPLPKGIWIFESGSNLLVKLFLH